ncbi:peptidase S9 [Lactobacillus nasalidis]|uniref:Peptidase S9 n=1 Tax=Lactobacillus nasalidis TaxID=2797258 RepID=A0ABQ3W594_9LACO|nr:S9 family peptidase [Lactobacillus nasalidis]GHV98426.1 peptidase S9 [Lactobacillus nasalidis]GHV98805.1 peptidase S9 [Lactobacillus nasalidis]GHW01153.1 peptidase S9 [Lactobacillus nasalidis]
MEAIKIEDFLHYANLGRLKAKGDQLVWVKGLPDADKKAKYFYTLETLKNVRPAPLSSFGEEKDFVFLDEQTVCFAGNRTREKGKSFIYKLDLTGGEAQVIAALDGEDYAVEDALPGGRLLLSRRVDLREAEKKQDPDQQDYIVLDEFPAYFNGDGIISKFRDRLFVFDPAKQELTELLQEDPYFNFDLHYVAGSVLYFAGDSYTRSKARMPGLYRLDLDKLESRQLLPAGQWTIFDIFVLKGRLFLAASDEKRYGSEENPQFYEYAAGKGLRLAAAWDDCWGDCVDTDLCLMDVRTSRVFDERLYFTTTKVDHTVLECFDGEKVSPVFEFPSIEFFDFTSDGICWFTGPAANETQQLYSFKDGKIAKHSNYNAAALKGRYVAPAVQTDYEDWAGKLQHGWVLYPKDFDETKKYPAILDVHGGPKTVYGTPLFHEMQVWAGRGYFVFFANIYGSDGQGNDYANMRGHWGREDYEDLMKFTDAVLAKVPQIDPDRLGITGGSYGGYMTNWVIGHTHRFKAAASQRSMSNWLSDAFMSDVGPLDDLYAIDAADLDDKLDYAWQQSPLKYAKNVTTPTLFLHSLEDYRCPLPEGMQMFRALLYYGVDCRMCLFKGENHELSRSGQPKHRIRRLREITSWFDQHLR